MMTEENKDTKTIPILDDQEVIEVIDLEEAEHMSQTNVDLESVSPQLSKRCKISNSSSAEESLGECSPSEDRCNMNVTNTSESVNFMPFLMKNLTVNTTFLSQKESLPFNMYRSFLESPVQHQYLSQMHLPTYNCIKYNLCRSRTISASSEESTASREKNSIKALRQWRVTRSGNELNKLPKKMGFTFKLMCYNVLAQSLLEEHHFLYYRHSPDALKWEERWKNLRNEIIEHDPDILCMQEVQETHLKDYYETLKNLGYKSLYKKRTGFKVDGCAIYYKSDYITLLEHTSVEYNQSFSAFFDRDNVALIARFAPKLYPRAEFVVATTHLLYNPKREDVRLAQVQLLLSELDRMAYKSETSDESYPYVPIILTGDFNTQPYSPVYKLITNGKLYYEYLTQRTLETASPGQYVIGKRFLPPILGITDSCQHINLTEKRRKRQISRDEEVKMIKLKNSERSASPERMFPADRHRNLFSTGMLNHSLQLKSAFKHKNGNKYEATTYQNGWLTVDYIFYSSNTKTEDSDSKLKLISHYTIPTADQLTGVRIPNFEIGSDHLSLLAKFWIEE